MQIYELSVRAHIAEETIHDFLSAALGIPPSLVGSESDYWERTGTSNPLRVGLKVLWDNRGYQTFVTWFQAGEVPTDTELLILAQKAAKYFGSDVAIGDVIAADDSEPGRYLVLTPEGQVLQATETINGEYFDLAVQSTPIEKSVIDDFVNSIQ